MQTGYNATVEIGGIRLQVASWKVALRKPRRPSWLRELERRWAWMRSQN